MEESEPFYDLVVLVIPAINYPISATVSASKTATILFPNPCTNNMENNSTDSAIKHK